MPIVAKKQCHIYPRGDLDVYGHFEFEKPFVAYCGVVRLVIGEDKTSVRADSSASRGHADEIITKSRLLFLGTTLVHVDDLVEVDEIKMKVTDIQRRYDVGGRLDHLQVELEYWASS